MDDTWFEVQAPEEEAFIEHINSPDKIIKFPKKNVKDNKLSLYWLSNCPITDLGGLSYVIVLTAYEPGSYNHVQNWTGFLDERWNVFKKQTKKFSCLLIEPLCRQFSG